MPLIRRMLVLVVLGALHHLLQPGEVLLWYGLVGLVVLLPFSYLNGRTNLLVDTVRLAAAVSTGLGILMIPGAVPGRLRTGPAGSGGEIDR